MADTTPRLPTTVDATDYAPYSVLAVVALAVAGLFAIILLVLSTSAWLAGQPLFEPELLIIAAVALALAFAARRQIVNSEGTRVGLPLCTAAWWIAIIGGLGFAAYLIGVGFAIRRDAEDAFKRWSDVLLKVNPLDAKNVDLATAFHATLPADRQSAVLPNDTIKPGSIFSNGILAFRQSDLVRLAARNGGDLRFEVVGLEDWKNEKSGALNCRLTIKAISPEGESTMSVAMQRQTLKGKNEPVWQIVMPQNESTQFFKPGGRTNAYGERLRDMELSAHQLVHGFFLPAVAWGGHQAKIFDEFTPSTSDPQQIVERMRAGSFLRMGVLGGAGWSYPEPADKYLALARKHFIPLDRGDHAREEEQRKQFIRCWQGGVIMAPGQILNRSPDVNPILVPGPNAWEVRIPVEMKTSIMDIGGTAARGVVVCVVDDPAFLKELAALKANPGPLMDVKYRVGAEKPVPWRIARIESDMKLQSMPRQAPGSQP